MVHVAPEPVSDCLSRKFTRNERGKREQHKRNEGCLTTGWEATAMSPRNPKVTTIPASENAAIDVRKIGVAGDSEELRGG